MATTVAQLQVEVNSLRLEVATLRAEMEASIPMLQKLLADALEQVKQAAATTVETVASRHADRVARSTPCGTTQIFPSPREAMEACKALVARRDGNRYSVTGCTLNVVAR